ncbi:MAG: hypothetical protein Q4P30_03575 [Eubacteriales bacterium]|nr:hypothetical protein [Eubacteriales bacterium]
MQTFYNLPEWGRLAFGFTMAVAVILQTAAIVHKFFNDGVRREIRWGQDFFQVFILFQLLMMVYLVAQVGLGFDAGYIVASGRQTLRYILFFVLSFFAVIYFMEQRQVLSPLAFTATFFTLPLMEVLAGERYTFYFTAAVIAFIVQSTLTIAECRRLMRYHFSARSVKHAIDTLPAGIMFCRKDGSIRLVNLKMQELMQQTTDMVHRNGEVFYREYLTAENVRPDVHRIYMDDIVYELPDKSIWLFKRSDTVIERIAYMELTAVDITAEWRATLRVYHQNKQLKKRSDKLKEMTDRLYRIYRQEEVVAMKNRFHNILGQKIALLMHNLRERTAPDDELLHSFVEELRIILREVRVREREGDKLDTLVNMMAGIGVSVRVSGPLPQSKGLADLFSEIALEATTNAVRHGLATEVNINFSRTDDGWCIHISDNGRSVSEEIVEGGGFTSIRKSLAAYGGRLEIRNQPKFEIFIALRGDDHD